MESNIPGIVDITQLEVDTRTEIVNLKKHFNDKPFTASQVVKLFRGDKKQATGYIENLNSMGALVTVQADGMNKYMVVADLGERKKNIQQNIEELEEFLAPFTAQMGMLKILHENIDKI